MQRLALALLVGAAIPAHAWGQGWVAELSAGGVTHQTVGADVGSSSAIAGVRHDGDRWLYLYAGAPLESGGLPWGAAGAGARVEAVRSRFSPGADLSLQLHGYRDRTLSRTGTGATADLLPYIAFDRGDARLELHTGARLYAGAWGDSTFHRALLDHGARLGYSTPAGLGASVDARLVNGSEGSFPYLGGGVQLAAARGTAWATAGRWLSGELPTSAWALGGSLEVVPRTRLELSFQQEGSDPLYWNPARRSWSVGVARALGRSATTPAPFPVADGAAGGMVTIRLKADAGAEPSVGGDFTEWKPVRMTRSGDEWVARFPLGSGVYRYAFRAGDGEWFVPESVPGRVDDGFGGYSAVLIVP
jgi:hypothetical protein